MKSNKACAKIDLEIMGIKALVKDMKSVEYHGPYEIPEVGTRSLQIVKMKDGTEYAYFSNLANSLWIAEADEKLGYIPGKNLKELASIAEVKKETGHDKRLCNQKIRVN